MRMVVIAVEFVFIILFRVRRIVCWFGRTTIWSSYVLYLVWYSSIAAPSIIVFGP